MLLITIIRIFFWIGGLYGIIMGIYIAFGPIVEYRTSTGYGGYTTIPVEQSILFTVITLLLFGGAIVLLTKQRWAFIASLLAIQAILEVVTLPSFGILFIPATLLIAMSTLILWLSDRQGERQVALINQ